MLTIGKLAKEVNIGVETVRYYQRKGLIDVPNKTEGYRKYSQEDLRRLKFIKEAQKAGFTLNEIKELLELDTSHDHQRAQQLASARIKELDEPKRNVSRLFPKVVCRRENIFPQSHRYR